MKIQLTVSWGIILKRMQIAKLRPTGSLRAIRSARIAALALMAACFGKALFIPAWAEDKPKGPPETATETLSNAYEPPERNALEMSIEQAMWAALAFEDTAKLRNLLKHGADPNKPEQLSQMTPLMAADTAAIAQILLDSGADPNSRDRIGRTVLHHAVKMREAGSIVRLLCKAGADVNARATDNGGSTPLLSAVEHYLEDKDRSESALAIRILIHLGADINATDSTGRSALILAATYNQPELIRLLIELGADPERRMLNGRTPLDYAREAKAEDAIQALASAPSKQPAAN